MDGNYQQGLSALLVFLCSTALHFTFLPYEVKELNYLEGVGLVVSMMTLYLGLWTFSISWSLSSVLVSALIFIINSLWILCVMIVISSSFGSKIRSAFVSVSDFFVRHLSKSPRNETVRSESTSEVTGSAVVDPPPKKTPTDRSSKKDRSKGDYDVSMMSSQMINPLQAPSVQSKIQAKKKAKEVRVFCYLRSFQQVNLRLSSIYIMYRWHWRWSHFDEAPKLQLTELNSQKSSHSYSHYKNIKTEL